MKIVSVLVIVTLLLVGCQSHKTDAKVVGDYVGICVDHSNHSRVADNICNDPTNLNEDADGIIQYYWLYFAKGYAPYLGMNVDPWGGKLYPGSGTVVVRGGAPEQP